MEQNLVNRMIFFPDVLDWKRGSASLHTEKQWFPRLMHCAYQQRPESVLKREEHAHKIYHICLYENSAGSMVFKGQSLAMKAGSLVLISPNEPHCFLRKPDENPIYSEVTFEILDDSNYNVECTLPHLLSLWTGENVPDWPIGTKTTPKIHNELLTSIANIAQASLLDNPAKTFHANRCLLNLLQIVCECLKNRCQQEDDPIRSAANIIERNFTDSISISKLAQQVGFSTNHFIRSFQEQYGQTPLAYQQQLKLNAAKRLLTQTNYPIKTIADWTGYNDVFYFSRQFSSKCGNPPGEYRRLHKT